MEDWTDQEERAVLAKNFSGYKPPEKESPTVDYARAVDRADPETGEDSHAVIRCLY